MVELGEQPLAGTSLSAKDQFDFLHRALSQFYTLFIDFEFKHGSLLALGIGWLITAENAQKFFAASLTARLGATTAMILLTGFHAFWVYKFYSKSDRAFHALKELNLVPSIFYEDLKIQSYMALTFGVIHASFSLLICVLLWRTVRA